MTEQTTYTGYFESVLNQCITLETFAIRLYQKLQKICEDQSLSGFWKNMVQQEIEHLNYWKTLLDLARNKKIVNIFDDPASVLNDLLEIERQIKSGFEKLEGAVSIKDAFILAFRVEFYMTHPAFAALFHLSGSLEGRFDMEKHYSEHIKGLQNSIAEFAAEDSELQLIADLVKHLWQSNQHISRQLAEIHSLREIMPICMHCKSIRDEENHWRKVEYYLHEQSGQQISHGICPVCTKKYYGDLLDDET